MNYSMTIAVCDTYKVQWELIEPKDDLSVYASFSKEHGPGLHHVAFGAEDYHETMGKLSKMENPEIQSGV